MKDGGHVYVCCSACGAGLVDCWRNRPNEPERWVVQANCPFCGDHSFQVEIVGGFAHVGICNVVNDDEYSQSTKIDDLTVKGNSIVYQVEKAEPASKPVYNPQNRCRR